MSDNKSMKANKKAFEIVYNICFSEFKNLPPPFEVQNPGSEFCLQPDP